MKRRPRTALPGPRLHELDFARGAALFGILVVNLPYLGSTTAVAGGVPAPSDAPGLLAWGLMRALFEFKFVSLFSLLFGMSLFLQRESLLARGGRWIPQVLRRHAFLCVVGLLHGVALFQGDILLPFAILGTLALVAFRLPNRVVVALAVGLVAAGVVLSIRGALVEGIAREPAAPATPWQGSLAGIRDLLPAVGESLASVELRVFREGPAWAALALRGLEYGIWLFVSTLFLGFNARVLALMLLGIALLRAGALETRWSATRRKLGLAGWIVGLPLEIGTTGLLGIEPDRGPGMRAAIAAAHEIGATALALAFATTLIAWAQSAFAVSLRTGVAAAGRMAFTSYLSQSVVACLLFTGLGLAWYGERSRAELLGLAVVIFATQVTASRWWLGRFEMGPLEWVWRCVTHWRKVEMGRRSGSVPGRDP